MKSDPTVEPKERLVSATVAFVRTHVWLILAVSALVVAPCLWHPRIEAGDLGSHVYNAWLVQLIQRGQAPGLYIANQHVNILFDLIMDNLVRFFNFRASRSEERRVGKEC